MRVVLDGKEIEADRLPHEGRDSESCTVVGTTRRAYSNSREPLNMCRREEETQPGLFFSSTPVLRPKKAILRRIHTVAALGLVGMWERLHVIDGHSWLFFSFSLFSSLSSVFACLRELSLPAGCLFHGFLFILHCFSFILNSTRDRPSIGPRPFSTSAIYDFILGQVDRRRYNTTTTALLSLDCYTTAIISNEHFDSGAFAWLVLMWPQSIPDSNPGR